MTTYLHTHRGETVRIFDLLKGGPNLEGTQLDGHDFEDCEIQGPAVVIPKGGLGFVDCTINEKIGMVLIPVDPAAYPDGIVGVIAVRDCRFRRCRFQLVSFLADPLTIEEFRRGFGG